MIPKSDQPELKDWHNQIIKMQMNYLPMNNLIDHKLSQDQKDSSKEKKIKLLSKKESAKAEALAATIHDMVGN